MTTEIEAKEVIVGKLFSPDFMFKIPIYQRPLSWIMSYNFCKFMRPWQKRPSFLQDKEKKQILSKGGFDGQQ